MKTNKKLPTILGVIILLLGVVTGVVLINSQQVFKIGADVEAVPKNVRISNITDSAVTVSWTTDIPSNGFVKWGKTEITLGKVALEETSEKSFVHSANLLGIDANSDILFKISSDGKDYNNQGISWQASTIPKKNLAANNLIASGTILKSDAGTPAKALVYLTVNGEVLSALTSDKGTFVIPISTFFDNLSASTAVEVTVQAGADGSSQAVIYPKSIKFIPAMILGRTYDFRTLQENANNEQPESSLTVPESLEISSRFEITRTETTPSTETVKIESIDEGEIITTVDPEFFGTGPKNADVEIVVESELQTETVNTGADGSWSWDPPKDLEPGQHKLTVKWRDAQGILRTITRTFIVSAAEGPAFESTPSATPIVEAATPTAISSSSPSATTKATKTPTTTTQPTPETGSLTPTMGLFIMGMGIFLSSIFVYKKSNA